MLKETYNLTSPTSSCIETRRGGCLDQLIQIMTGGRWGVETSADIQYQDQTTGEIFPDNPVVISFQTNKTVIAPNVRKIVSHVSHHIVSNHS